MKWFFIIDEIDEMVLDDDVNHGSKDNLDSPTVGLKKDGRGIDDDEQHILNGTNSTHRKFRMNGFHTPVGNGHDNKNNNNYDNYSEVLNNEGNRSRTETEVRLSLHCNSRSAQQINTPKSTTIVSPKTNTEITPDKSLRQSMSSSTTKRRLSRESLAMQLTMVLPVPNASKVSSGVQFQNQAENYEKLKYRRTVRSL